jgi:ATP-dependent DNA helicase RecG
MTTHSNDIKIAREIALVDELRGHPAEMPWIEFKVNNTAPDQMAKTISALSNAARLADKHDAYMVWGIEDGTHDVVGTTFEPAAAKHGNEPLEFWLSKALDPNPNVTFNVVHHPKGRVVVLEVPAATHAPVKYDGHAYVRIGSANTRLSDNIERERDLWTRLQAYAWETAVALQYVTPEAVVEMLDVQSYFELTKTPMPGTRVKILERLQRDKLISADVGGNWNILNLGAALFARKFATFPRLSRKALRVVQYEGRSRVKTKKEQPGVRGYASTFESLITYLKGILPQEEVVQGGRQISVMSYPEITIRELVANALIHQDMTITGAGPMIEIFDDRVEITNPGKPLIAPDRFLDMPPRSRNEALASMMRRMNFCEERGSGIDKVITAVELAGLPPPDFQVIDLSTRATLLGPRRFSEMTPAERVRACYQHAALQWLKGERATNASFRKRFGAIEPSAAQISRVFSDARDAELIKLADQAAPKSGYEPNWA